MTKMLNVRVDEDLLGRIDSAAEDAGVSRSVWMREILAHAVDAEPHPQRALALQASTAKSELARQCMHPTTARRRLPFQEVCTLCGARVK